jgi:TP901 family phage tail tape measure protein
MTLFDLVAKISLDTSEYDKGLSGASGKFSTFGNSLKSGFGKVAKLGATALAGASTAVMAFGASSVKTGMTFDKSMSQVAATMGKTMDEMQNEVGEVDLAWGHFSGNLRDYAQEMGAHTAFSASEAADALNYMALAGYDTEKSMSMLPNVLNLAAAGGMDLATASDMVTDASSALGLSTQETTEMVDKMAQASSKSNTSVAQLGQAMLTVGGTAKVLSGGTTELSTALGILADNGTKGAEGGTALRNILTSLQGGKFEKTFGAMGISAYDAEGKMRSLKDIFGDMQVAMDGMTDEQRTDIINKTFNARDLKNVNALLGTSAQRWDELSASIDGSAGAAEKMANTQLDNLAGDITLFKSAMEGAQIALSDNLSPALRDFVRTGSEGMTEFTEKLKSGDFSGAMESIGGTLANLATVALSKVPDLISAGGQLLMGLAKGFITNAPTLLSGLTETLSTTFSSLTSSAGTLVSSGAEMIGKLGEGLVQGIPTFLAQALPMITQFSEFLRANAGTLISAGLGLIQNIAQGLINSIPLLVSYVPTIITNLAGIINDNAPKVLATGVNIIKNLVVGLIQAIPTIVANIPKIIQAIVAVWMAFNWLDLGKGVINFIKNGFESLKTTLPEALKNIAETAKEWFSAIDWRTLGADVIDLIKIGFETLGTAIPRALKAVGTTAISFFKSVNWASVGMTAITKIGSGIRGAAGLIKSAVKSIADNVKNTISKGFEAAKAKAVASFTQMKMNIFSALNPIVHKVMDIVNRIKGFFPLSIGKIFSNLKIPHISVSGGSAPFGIGGKGSLPKFHVSWNAKAMENPYLFSDATLFGAGETGDEMLYGRSALMKDITSAMDASKSSGGNNVQITNYITVDGAEDPEDFAERLVRKMQMEVRTA